MARVTYLSDSIYIYIRSICLQMVLEDNQRSTWGPPLRERRDALGGRNQVNSEMYLEAVIVREWR